MAIALSGSLILSGSITVSGSIISTGTISMSGSIASASYALNATTGAYANTSTSASYALNATTFNGLASSIFATTSSNTFIGNQVVSGSLTTSGSITATGTITAQTLVIQTITSSVVYSSGSNIFGNALANTQTFTGSVLVTGSLTIAGGSSATSYSGATIFGSTIACSPIGCFATSCATSFIGGTMSGTTIYGSTAVCSPVGKFTTCIDAGTGTFSGLLTGQAGILFPTTQAISTGGSIGFNSVQGLFIYGKTGTSYDFKAYNGVGSTFMQVATGTQNVEFLGITCFAGRICSPSITTDIVATIGSSFTCPSAANLSYGIFGYSGVGLGIAANASGANQGIGFFVCGDVERMRIITSGNVGIGTVCPNRALEITTTNTPPLRLTTTSGNTGIEFLTSASTYNFRIGAQLAVGNLFEITPSTTAGGTTFTTPALGITNGGAVGICTTSPVTRLSLNSYVGSRLPYINGTSNTYDSNGITVGNSNNGNTNIGGGIDFTNNCFCIGAYSPILSFSSVSSGYAYNNSYAGIWGVFQGAGGDANWNKGDLALGTAAAYGIYERMRILANGYVGIGTCAPGSPLQVNGTSGNILDVEGSATGTTQLQIGAPNISGANASLYMQSAGVVGGGWFIDRASSTLRGWAGSSSSGVTLYNGGTSFGTYSDERVKENIENIDTVLPNLTSLRTVKYHLKNVDTIESKKRYGLIAQDLIGKFDEALDFNRTDEIEGSQEGIYSLKYSEMVPVLIKAIQELKAENDIFKNCLGIN